MNLAVACIEGGPGDPVYPYLYIFPGLLNNRRGNKPF